ncbi:DUF3299 domain-containing protein [Leucothrix arctica]|uniref:DUF3299 domain-containing protein n=1 Tax=Leucothrix arctica TaxID=1481894 RepID=A0A317CAM5_9GAMM|nr:DUF3299 domain-containing protein [Leucothrix arctica]PWQ93132.1 DUF3299 domain-containing protein [Leucothrix arctica]
MKKMNIIPLLLSGLLLASCGAGSSDADKPLVSKIDPDVIELGTDIKAVVKQPSKAERESAATSEFKELSWDDLVPPDFRPEKIMAKYQAEIQAAKEGSEEERVLYDKVMAEFNSAGGNAELRGKTIRIPGFVAPLENDGETVVEFLLVPYYGSCIHSPPPPANQTVMVSPIKGKSITLDQTYRPVWVVGEMEVGDVETDLALAGYQIKNARVEPYVQPAY